MDKYEKIKKLQEETGRTYIECHTVLKATNYNYEKSLERLNTKKEGTGK